MFDKNDIQDAYPLTPMQEGMLFHYLLGKNDRDHIKLMSYELSGSVDTALFEKAFNAILDRYDVLRTIFLHEKVNNPLQVVLKKRSATIVYEDISELAEEKKLLYISQRNKSEIDRGFDLSKDVLIKISVFKLAQDRFRIVLFHHHIIIDGWSTGILLKELFGSYESLRNNKPLEYQPAKPFSHFIKWLEKQDPHPAEEFWKEYLNGFLSQTIIPRTGNPVPAVQKIEKRTHIIPADMVNALVKIARQNKVTANTLIQTIWGISLQKLNGSSDAVYGYVISGRPPEMAEITEMVGMFINTIPVRIQSGKDEKFTELASRIHSELARAKKYDFLPLVKIISRGQADPLFDHVVMFANFPMDALPEGSSLSIKGLEIFDQTNYDFVLAIIPEKEWYLEFKYNGNEFDGRFVEKLGRRVQAICEQIIENPDITVEDITVVLEEETQRILGEFNATDVAYPENAMLIDFFEKQAEQNSGRIAVKFGNSQMTYGELNRQANRLSRVLTARGAGPDRIIGILLDRSLEMIVSILAVLKARGAYMPIDPDYPPARKDFMISDSGTALVITNGKCIAGVAVHCDTVLLDDVKIPLAGESDENPARKGSPEDLAYVIYTSGSTGMPKGALIENRNVVRLFFNDRFQFDFSENDVWTIFHSFCFDFSVWEMYGALLFGGTAILVPKETAIDPERFREILKKENVTILNQTPAAFYNLAEEEKRHDDGLSVRNVIFGGDALTPALLAPWKMKYARCALINMYGITETTVHVTYKEIGPAEIEKGISNIGKPIPTLKTYIVDDSMKLVPVNVAGELCVAGAGVCRGYLNRPELTAEKFIENPFHPGERLYKSGDLGHYLENGDIVYLGRKDNQVQLHGFRVELGEVEQALLRIDGIRQAVVLYHSPANQSACLCGYYVSETVKTVEHIREALKAFLPDYMVPSYFIHLDAIPLNVNGKIDRQALPKPEASIHSETSYVAPRDELEIHMVDIWKETLGLEKIGINDNFFSLGGDSIISIRLVSKINKHFKSNMRIPDFYNHQTVKELVAYLKSRESAIQNELYTQILDEMERKKNDIVKLYNLSIDNIEDIYPMSDIEKGMLFYSAKNAEEAFYYDQIVIQMNHRNFDIERSKKALYLLFQKHSNLRAGFILEQSIKIVYKHIDYPIEYFDISGLSNKEQETKINAHLRKRKKIKLDLEKAPLWRMTFFKISDTKVVFIWEEHHAILDGWSEFSFFTEYTNVLARLETEPAVVLPGLKASYKDHVIEELLNKRDENAKKFWKNELRDYTRFYFPKICPEKQRGYFGRNLNPDLKKECIEFSVQTNVPLRHLGFAAYRFMLHMLSYKNDIVVGLLTNNRPVCEDGDRLVGCFLKTIPVRMKLERGVTWLEYVKAVDKKMIEIRNYDKLSLLDIMHASGERTADASPLFDAIFNFVDFHIFEDLSNFDVDKDVSHDLNLEGCDETNIPFTFTLEATLDKFFVEIKYLDLFINHDFIDTMVSCFEKILETIVRDPGGRLDKGSIPPEGEKAVLWGHRPERIDVTHERSTISALFEKQVARTPEKTAVIFEHQHLSYYELNEKADRLAKILIGKGVQANDRVGILLDRSIEMIVGILAVLKARAAYVAVDPDYPAVRQNLMLTDSMARFLITVPELVGKLDYHHAAILINDDAPPASMIDAVHLPAGHPEDLAYVMYTSGSSGKPKGTLIENRNVTRLFSHDWLPSGLDENDVWTLFHSFCFDFSVWEMFGALLSGGRLIVLPKTATRDFTAFRNILKSENVTILNQTPSAFYALLSEEKNHDDRLSVRTVILGGEALHPSRLRFWKEKYPECILLNMYGITETAVHSTYKEITFTEIRDGLSTVGRALPTDTIYIMDEDGNALPHGVTGEICVAGHGVGRGYLNEDQLTAEKFIMNPHHPGERMYVSGDFAYVAPDGDLVYVGRRDDQIKLKGFRLELNEVNHALGKHPDVKESAVLVRKDKNGNDRLYGYVVLYRETSADELQDHVRRMLPYYMVPSVIVPLEEIPLTENGKIDKEALPLADTDRSHGGKKRTPPRNRLEQFLVAIWRDVLDWRNLGIHDDLFSMGADSIKLVHVVSKIAKAGYAITIPDVFTHPTIALLSEYLEKVNPGHELADGIVAWPEEPDGQAADTATGQNVMVGEIPLTVSQKEFLDTKIVHNWTGAFVLEAFDEGLNPELLEKACRLVLERHDSLRAGFMKDARGWKQFLAPPDEVTLPVRELDYSAFSDDEQLARLESLIMSSQSVMDLAVPPLIKFTLVNRGENKGSFLFILSHHLILDGLSMDLLLEEISHLYASFLQGTAPGVPEKPLPAYAWIDIVAGFVNGGGLQEEIDYWNRALENKIGQLRLDFPENAHRNRINTSAYHKINLSVEQTSALGRGLPTHAYMPISNLLLAGLTLAVAEYSRNEWILMEVIDSGRGLGAEFGVDLSRTVGWLSHPHNLLLRVDPLITDKKSALLAVIDQIRRAPVNDLRLLQYHKDEKSREILNRMPRTPVCFNYLGTRKSAPVSSNRIEDFANNIRGQMYWIHPDNERPNILGCNTEIVNDELVVIFDYSRELHKEETIVRLMDSYLEYLRT